MYMHNKYALSAYLFLTLKSMLFKANCFLVREEVEIDPEQKCYKKSENINVLMMNTVNYRRWVSLHS